MRSSLGLEVHTSAAVLTAIGSFLRTTNATSTSGKNILGAQNTGFRLSWLGYGKTESGPLSIPVSVKEHPTAHTTVGGGLPPTAIDDT